MKKINCLWIGIMVFIGLLSCEGPDVSENDLLTVQEASLNIKAPCGVKIASDVYELKQKLSNALPMLRSDNFELVSIEYFPVKYGYCAKIVYLKDDQKVGCVAMSDCHVASSGLLTHIKTRSEGGGTSEITYCENVSCTGECSIEFKTTTPGGDIVFGGCVCDEGRGTGKCVKKTKPA